MLYANWPVEPPDFGSEWQFFYFGLFCRPFSVAMATVGVGSVWDGGAWVVHLVERSGDGVVGWLLIFGFLGGAKMGLMHVLL